jgi:hypothetical protein
LAWAEGIPAFAIARSLELAQQQGAELAGVTVVDVGRLGRIGPASLGASASARERREFRLPVAQEHVEEAAEQFVSACRNAAAPRAYCCVEEREKRRSI